MESGFPFAGRVVCVMSCVRLSVMDGFDQICRMQNARTYI